MNENDSVSGNDSVYDAGFLDSTEPVIEDDAQETLIESAPSIIVDADVSGNDVFMDADVSGNGIFMDADVSGNAAYTEVLPPDNTDILESLDAIHISIDALVFITLFIWIEQKIHTAVRRLFRHGKFD